MEVIKCDWADILNELGMGGFGDVEAHLMEGGGAKMDQWDAVSGYGLDVEIL